MNTKIRRSALLAAAVACTALFAPLPALAQAAAPSAPQEKPAVFGQPLADFTLPAYQGGEVSLASLRGKNVMMIFLRGYAAEGSWCTICNYQYGELIEMELAQGLRKAHNLEVLFVLPYDKDTVKAWVDVLPAQIEKIHGWKYPADAEKLDEAGRARLQRMRGLFPKDLSLKAPIPAPFPVLIDADRSLSKTLGLFRMEWGGSKVAQNVPTIMILDKDGVLRFKYMSQNTTDRPTYTHLFDVLGTIEKRK